MQSAERDLRINALLKAALHHKTFELNLVVNLNARAAVLRERTQHLKARRGEHRAALDANLIVSFQCVDSEE